jgi:Asp-tRNA(Asn)/Glu-tRNA(Gln) amidotransferase A subunit family amidase
MIQNEGFLQQYLLSAAREGDIILFQPPPWSPCAVAAGPTGLVAGTLVSWDMILVTLHVPSSKRGCQRIMLPSCWVRGFPLRLSLASKRDSEEALLTHAFDQQEARKGDQKTS